MTTYAQLISETQIRRDAATLDEDNEKFKDAVKAVKQQFGLTDEQVESILAASVAG